MLTALIGRSRESQASVGQAESEEMASSPLDEQVWTRSLNKEAICIARYGKRAIQTAGRCAVGNPAGEFSV